MSRTARLLEILITLRTRPRFTVEEMAEEFGVSRRTMLRDLHALSEMGVPLSATPGPGGGYSLITSRKLLPLSLTADEAIGIVLSYEAFLQYAESPFTAQSLSAVTKLRNAMPAEVVARLDRVHQHVVVLEPRPSYRAPLLPDILEAALDGVHLRIVYDSRSGVSERLIYPHGLYAAHGFWYCLCHDYRRERTLSLRVDRVRRLERVGGLTLPAPLSVPDWFEVSHRDAADFLPLRARVTARGAKSFELNTMFGEIPTDGAGAGVIEARIPASEIEYYADRFLTLGTELRVESPPELIEAMRAKAEAVACLYKQERQPGPGQGPYPRGQS
jgi:predicted DNA-binding transcriptional regulator YafY